MKLGLLVLLLSLFPSLPPSPHLLHAGAVRTVVLSWQQQQHHPSPCPLYLAFLALPGQACDAKSAPLHHICCMCMKCRCEHAAPPPGHKAMAPGRADSRRLKCGAEERRLCIRPDGLQLPSVIQHGSAVRCRGLSGYSKHLGKYRVP